MPLIVIVGGPCSGKTRAATSIKEFYESKGHIVSLLNEETLNVKKADCYLDSQSEKMHRTHIRSEVEKNISDKTITIVDTLNYIKGSRYEFYCLVRNCKTRHCVIYCNTKLEDCLEFNKAKSEYPIDLLKDLYSRMEEPIQNNRWDCPMYTLYPKDEIPFDNITVSIFEGKKPKEPVSSKPELTFDTNFLFQLDKTCQDIIHEILLQQDNGISDCFKISDTHSLYLKKKFSATELKKIKLEFIKISKVHPPKDKNETIQHFVEYLFTVQDRY